MEVEPKLVVEVKLERKVEIELELGVVIRREVDVELGPGLGLELGLIIGVEVELDIKVLLDVVVVALVVIETLLGVVEVSMRGGGVISGVNSVVVDSGLSSLLFGPIPPSPPTNEVVVLLNTKRLVIRFIKRGFSTPPPT